MFKKPFRMRCLNRSHPSHFDEDTFICSLHGLVARQCCIECETKALETPIQKLERKINLNVYLIDYHMNEIGELRKENAKLEDRLHLLHSKQ